MGNNNHRLFNVLCYTADVYVKVWTSPYANADAEFLLPMPSLYQHTPDILATLVSLTAHNDLCGG